jgi:uncharacterized protein DUF3592
MTSPAQFWLPWIFLAAGVVIAAVRFLWSRGKQELREHAARSWPVAEASIETFYVAHINRGDSRRGWQNVIPVLQYSYVVAGERYSGSANLGVWESDEDSAHAAGKGWVGEKIRVRYKPGDPATSAWLEGDGAPAGVRGSLPDGSDNDMIDLELNR